MTASSPNYEVFVESHHRKQMSDDETEFPDSTDSSGSTDEFIEKLEDELDDDGSDNSSSDEEAESQDSRIKRLKSDSTSVTEASTSVTMTRMMKEIILREALLLGILFSLCFFLSLCLLVGFALFCTILCLEPVDKKKKKNIELPLQKMKISKNGVPKETYRTKIVTAPTPKKLANNDEFGAVWSPFYF